MVEESNALPSRFAVFSTKEGKPSVVARFENDDVCSTQKQLAGQDYLNMGEKSC